MVSSRSLFNISIAIYAYFFPAIIVHLLKCAFLLWVGKHFKKGFPGGSVVKNPLAMQEMWVPSLGQEDPREEEMATHCSILAWRIAWTEEPGGLHRVEEESDMA